MELTNKMKEKTGTKEETKKTIEENGMILSDEALDHVSGGRKQRSKPGNSDPSEPIWFFF